MSFEGNEPRHLPFHPCRRRFDRSKGMEDCLSFCSRPEGRDWERPIESPLDGLLLGARKMKRSKQMLLETKKMMKMKKNEAHSREDCEVCGV